MKYAAMLFGGLWLYGASWSILDPIGGNPHGEYCAYVEPGEPYDLIFEGLPCRLTSQLFFVYAFLAVIGAFLQIPTLILWINIAYRQWRKKKAPPPTDTCVQQLGNAEDG